MNNDPSIHIICIYIYVTCHNIYFYMDMMIEKHYEQKSVLGSPSFSWLLECRSFARGFSLMWCSAMDIRRFWGHLCFAFPCLFNPFHQLSTSKRMLAHFFCSLVTLHLWTCWTPKLCSVVEPQEEGNGSLCKARRDCEQAFEGWDECWWCFVLWIGREIDWLLICAQGIVDLFLFYDLVLSCVFFEMRKLI